MYGLDYVALRYFNVYGPRMDIHGVYTEVLVRWMERIAAGQPPLILGDGRQTMDFVHVDDIARANMLAAASRRHRRGVQRRQRHGDEPARAGARAARRDGRRPAVEHGPARAVNGVARRLADTTRARERLGFEAQVDAATTGLRGLVEWWRAEQRGGRGAWT